jgi:hypothetical protein
MPSQVVPQIGYHLLKLLLEEEEEEEEEKDLRSSNCSRSANREQSRLEFEPQIQVGQVVG